MQDRTELYKPEGVLRWQSSGNVRTAGRFQADSMAAAWRWVMTVVAAAGAGAGDGPVLGTDVFKHSALGCTQLTSTETEGARASELKLPLSRP